MSALDLLLMLLWVIEWGPWVGAAGLALMVVGLMVILRHRRRTWRDENLLEPLSDLDEVVYVPGTAKVGER